MRIIFFTRLYYPHIGGVEKHVAGISQVLSHRHSITIVTEQFDQTLPEYEKINGVEIYRIPTAGVGEREKKWRIWKWVLAHSALLDQADILHAHDVYFWIIPYKLLHPFKKTYVTFHGWEGQFPIPLKNIVIRKACELLANGNICIGDFIAKWYTTRPDAVSYGAV